MKQQGNIFKIEFLLLACTGLFLCVLLAMFFHDKATLAKEGVETERFATAEAVRAKPEPVDLNTAEQEDLERLPGIGEELARRILAYREETGGFTSLEELMNVSGIGEKKFAALDGYITVNGGDEP